MIDLYTPAQVRAGDERTIASGTSATVLMDRAAGHLARTVRGRLDRAYGARVLLVCGKGNNAGDGIAAARLLRRGGVDARVHLAAGDHGLSADAKAQLQRYRAAGGRLAPLDCNGMAVVVDCLLGTGTAGEPREPLAAAVRAINDYRTATTNGCVVACDIPTGADAETGALAETAVHADVTMTIGAHKTGLWLWPASGAAGHVECADIGLDVGGEEPVALVLEPTDVRRQLRPADAGVDKRGRGVVVVLAGSPGMSGAATMVARGALRMGVGLLTVATDAETRDLVAPTVPEAMTVGLALDDPEKSFRVLTQRLGGADVLAIGPGLGHEGPVVDLVRRLVREIDVPIVLDADGLNAFRDDGNALADRKGATLVCTPHAREFARLLGQDVDDVWPRRREVASAAAQRWDATIVAKGPGSLVCDPAGRVLVNSTGSAALATGGTGDVLTGMIASAVATNDSADAVAAAVHVHGLAGTIAAARLVPRSVAALDVAAAIPAALSCLESS